MTAQWAQFDHIGGPEAIRIVDGDLDREVERLTDDEVLVEMRAAGLNSAELMHLGGYYVVPTTPPCRMGIERAGVVVAAGDQVDGFDVGDEVVVLPDSEIGRHGTLATHAAVPARALEPKPSEIGFEDAAAFWVAHGTAYAGLVQDGGLEHGRGQVVVISAASSSVGLAALHIARRHGATVIATTRSAAKRSRLLDAGADHVIVTNDQDPAVEIAAVSNGAGFDIAFDSVAGSWIETLVTAAAPGARLVIYGGQSGEPKPMPLGQMLTANLQVSALHFVFDVLRVEHRRHDMVEHLRQGLADGAYRPVVDSTFALADVADAYRHMASNKQFGKLVVTTGPASATT